MLAADRCMTRSSLDGIKEARTLYARISTLAGSPGQIDEGLRYVRDNVLPQIQQQDGFKGMTTLANRESGKTLGITYWESEEALRASEEAAEKMHEDSAEALADTIAGVERFEVGFMEMSSYSRRSRGE